MKRWILFHLCILGVLKATTIHVNAQDEQTNALDDTKFGDRGVKVIETHSQHRNNPFEREECETQEKCLPGEYLDADDCRCHLCYAHDAPCSATRQCCSTSHMSCWKYGFNPPLCKCDPDYAWNSTSKECYPAPMPPLLIITAYTALGSACVIALAAICVQVCSMCAKKCRRSRYSDQYRQGYRHQFRRHGRRQAPRVPRLRRISSLSPRPNSDDLPSKPPEYEDVFGLPTVSQALERYPNGTVRSLPPAYSPREENKCQQSNETTQVNEPTTSNTEVKVTVDPVTTVETEGGVVNPSFTQEQHI